MDIISATTIAGDAKVEVGVRAEYMSRITVAEGVYCFAYQITIHNIGKVAFQLISRHWKITDGNGKMREVSGEGVVGKQPRLPPSYAFSYTSYVDLPTPVGAMSGIYTMKVGNLGIFEAIIPCFSLFVPQKIN